MKRIAIYYRVSTADQTTEPQRLELNDYCRRRGWTADLNEYSDKISGAKWSRVGLDALMRDVRKGKIDVVLCAKLDRLGRSLPHLAQLLGEMDAHRCALVCASQGIDTTDDNPAGRLQVHVLMAVAEFERSLIRERTKAGLVAARARGSVLGRPRFELTPGDRATVDAWRESGGTFKALAAALGCSIGKAHHLAKLA